MNIIDPAIPSIFESWKPFDDFFYTDHRGWIVPDVDRIRSLAQRHDFVLANCSTEHWGNDIGYPLSRRLHDILLECDLEKFIILTHDPGLESLPHRILYFPFWFWKRSMTPLTCPDFSSPPSYWISSLAGQARPFRIANYLYMLSKSYLSQCVINIWRHQYGPSAYDEGLELTEQEKSAWQTLQNATPQSVDDGHPRLGTTHPAWSNACLNLVNESTIRPGIFITEKTWKPIMSGQMFVIFGNAGIIAELRRLGFDVFDDMIDHGYDSEPDARSRLNKLHTELDRLAKPDLVAMTLKVKHRRYENWIRFREHTAVDTSLESIRNLLAL